MNPQKIKSRFFKSENRPLIFVLIVGILGFFTHVVYTRSGWMINPDESELIATARLAAMPGGVNANYTTATYGPIWPEFLALLNQAGMTLDHFNAHRLALIMKMFIFLIPQYVAMRKIGVAKLSLVLIPINIAVFLPSTTEFAFLSTGLLPLAFLTVAVIVILKMKHESYLIIVSALFSLAFLSKYQSLLMSVIILFFIFLRHVKEGVVDFKLFFRALVGFIFFTFTSLTLFVMLLISNNSFEKFFKESFLFSINYSTSEGFGGGLSILGKIKGGSNLLVSQPLLVCTFFLIIILIKTSSLTKLSLKFSNKVITLEAFALLSLCIFLTVGFLTIAIPGNEFPHYLLFFIWTTVMFCTAFAQVSTVVSVKPNPNDGSIRKMNMGYYAVAVALIVAMVGASSLAWSVKNVFDSQKIITNNDALYKALGNSEVLQHCPRNSRVLVWGWSSELFAYFDWVPVPDVVNDVARIKFSNLSEGSRSRIAKAVSTKKAECVYEAIGTKYFGGFNLDDSIETIAPNIFKDLNQNYRGHILADGTKVWSRIK
jgi:hypothetical protein